MPGKEGVWGWSVVLGQAVLAHSYADHLFIHCRLSLRTDVDSDMMVQQFGVAQLVECISVFFNSPLSLSDTTCLVRGVFGRHWMDTTAHCCCFDNYQTSVGCGKVSYCYAAEVPPKGTLSDAGCAVWGTFVGLWIDSQNTCRSCHGIALMKSGSSLKFLVTGI